MPQLERLDWLKRYRKEHCLVCKPRNLAFSLVKTVCWCPQCEKVWRFRYYNQDQSLKKAFRLWWYEDNSGCYMLTNDGRSIKLEKKNGRKDRGNGIQA